MRKCGALLLVISMALGSLVAFADAGDTAPGYEEGTLKRGFMLVVTNRKLKEGTYRVSVDMDKRDLGGIYAEDYPRFDPTPSSKAAIKNGPIEHGTPLMPYVPRLTPPAGPAHGPAQAPRHGSP